MKNAQFVDELSKLNPASTFLAVHRYRNNFGELANYNIIFHMSYKNALKRSIAVIEAIVPDSGVQFDAKLQVLKSLNESLEKYVAEETGDCYSSICDRQGKRIKGIKLHGRTNIIHLYGLVHSKAILEPGDYPIDHRKAFTIEKENLRAMCPVGRFRQFKMVADRVDHIKVQGISLLPPGNKRRGNCF